MATRNKRQRDRLILLGIRPERLDEEVPDLAGANLRDADLSGMDLAAADLRGSDVRGANFTGTKLRRARLAGAKVDDAALDTLRAAGADVAGAITESGVVVVSERGLRAVNLSRPEPPADSP